MYYFFRLYVSGHTPNSTRAVGNIRKVLDSHLKGVYSLTIIDVLKRPQLAEEDMILATPTLVKLLPSPAKRVIGDLSDWQKILRGLDLRVQPSG